MGYFPGTTDSSDLSTFLKESNDNPLREADHTYAIYGKYDGSAPTLMIYGKNTC